MADIVRYTPASSPAPRGNRAIRAQVQQAAAEVDAVMALAAHIIDRAGELDNYRQQRAQGDPHMNAIFSEFEANTFMQAKRIQNRMGSGF